MEAIIKPIARNEKSHNVSLLHQALAALGMAVSPEEVARREAGQATLSQVRTLQGRLNLPIDDATLVDEATALAITEALHRRGLMAASRTFTVAGAVRLLNGAARKRQPLLAFDLDLRGVGVYRRVKSLADIEENGGFEFLGQAVSDNLGNYRISFYEWQYSQAERKKADVVVYAIEGDRIAGRSRLVNSEDYSDKGLVNNLGVLITQPDQRTEYEALMAELNAFLKESRTSLAEIALSRDQLVFTAGELDVDQSQVNTAAAATLLAGQEECLLSHELQYGIGRQNISLSWVALYKKQAEELRRAIARSVEQRIIREFPEEEIAAFLEQLGAGSVRHLLDDQRTVGNNTTAAMLKNALPEEKQRVSFLNALNTFKGSDFRDFWTNHLPAQSEFSDNPQLVSSLLITQQLSALSGNHQSLVHELQGNGELTSIDQLIALEPDDWREAIKEAGVPDFIEGANDDEKGERYAGLMQNLLNAAFPTQRITRMVGDKKLSIANDRVSTKLGDFLLENKQFDIASSRIHDFDEAIRAGAEDDFDAVRGELLKIQRVFQVSPAPEAMSVLMENNLHSAYTIANIPRKSFIKTYAKALGGETTAFAIHERASHISTRAEMAAMHIMEYSQALSPAYAMGDAAYTAAMTTLQNQVPNYAQLFGGPDICECEHCRSVYSAAAYLIDLLRFLWRGEPNDDGNAPLDMLAARRPDLLHLLLTCENTNTIIPYVDLANEVMEFYTASGSLATFAGYDTGEATAEELRANPQNFNLEAYRTINTTRYPFTLPYHQPLDVIRTYSAHLKVNRYEAMKAMNPEPGATTAKAIDAESLGISQEEYTILTGEAFDGTADATLLHEYFGYSGAGQLEGMSNVREFLHRSGVAYTDLVELVKTQFINPHQGTLDFLDEVFSYASIDPAAIYSRLEQIEAGTLDPATDAAIVAALDGYNSAGETALTAAEFGQWVVVHLDEFRQVITLYEPESKCDLDTTRLRTIQSIYEGSATSGITNDSWSKIHRFLRLWRKLGWTIHETDLMLAALGEDDLTIDTIGKLASVSALKTATRLPLNQLAALWGSIDTYGDKSLYKKLFLNKAVQEIDEAFEADAWGNYLQDESEVLADHQSAILAAFRITEEELNAILDVAEVVDGGNPRPIDMSTDALNLPNLSTIYRYVVLAKGLKMRRTDFCRLIKLFNATPFSTWDIQQAEFTGIDPADTLDFYQLAAATKEAGFKPPVLEYILQGTLPADSSQGLDEADALQTTRAIRAAFATIEQAHPETPATPLTTDTLAAKLSLTFQPDIVSRFMSIVDGTVAFETITDANLDVTIPENLAGKYSYVKGSGRLTAAGIMSESEQATLKGLANANANFQAAVDTLYAAPETFLSNNFNGVFGDLAGANAVLLDHPAQVAPATLDEKLAYGYEQFLPVLKSKLREDSITVHVAALIGLSQEATALLIANEIQALITDLATEGFSATYFDDDAWANPAVERTDNTIDFAWGAGTPDPAVPADNFSAHWTAYLAAPASGEVTLRVEVEEADEAFKLYLDEALILEKVAGDAATSWDVVADLNASRLHLLTLEYAEAAQNAGVWLSWKTATSAPEIIPSSATYPAAILDDFVDQATTYHQAALFIQAFELSETELDHLIRYEADFGNIDFQALDAGDWQRIRDYTALRNAVPQAQALLTDVFALANTPSPAPTMEELTNMLYLATAWDAASLDFLVDSHFALEIGDFKNEIALNRMREVMKIATRTGLSAATIAGWGAAQADFDALHDTGQLIKNTVKAKYEEEDWLDIAGRLSDKLRENQQQALVSYLLTQPAIQAWGAEDADGLFEYFLIDVQMGACMDTSRIVQANAAVQMFVNRCLLNLESDMSGGSEKGVSPGAIDKERWEWMKNYRVWEANRKVFLYPENWLEPEWRNDRSEFFRELESYLVQNDITERSVEQAFRNYLTRLNEVANLDVCGIHQENYDDGNLKYLHVFARTHNAPYKFFYRRWNEYRKWSAWETVPVDIRSVEDGANSGVHLIPVVWKKRLCLFWPEFIKVQEAPAGNSGRSVAEASGDQMSTLEPATYWEIRLGWSEYVDGKWTPKQVSKEIVTQWPDEEGFSAEGGLLFTASIEASSQELTIKMSDAYWNIHRGKFTLVDIQSSVQASHYGNARWNVDEPTYRYDFSKRTAYSQLELLDDVYLQNNTSHNLLPVDTFKGLDITLDHPFFFSDARRTYFVRPVAIRIVERLRKPDIYQPYMPELVDDSGQYIPIDIPDVGPDDFMPVEGFMQPLNDGNPAFSLAGLEATQPVMLAFTGSGDGHPHLMMMRSASTPPGLDGASTSALISYATEIAAVNEAFAGTSFELGVLQWGRLDTGLEFHTFYHPFSSLYIKNLNQRGVPGLLESDTELPSDEGATFKDVYDPNFLHGFVQKPSDFDTRTYYKENVCFDVYGANSLYNWELFFHAPLYIATRLSKNGQYEEAMKWFHHIFDPTTDAMPGPGESEISRYWKVRPFKSTPAESLEDWFRSLSPNADPNNPGNAIIAEWRANPFDPHLIASNRPLAYMKHVITKYVENLIAWGDSLFRQFTRESVYEALQIYVIANHILGPYPEFVPKRGDVKAESYDSLQNKWDDFSNALVELENIFPYSSKASASPSSTGTSLLGVGSALYFCIPANDKLLDYWDTVTDRLFKIRHCQDIDGVERKLALFAPPIDPAALIQAASQGLSLGSILADLSSPPPIYRFTTLIQKANEFCADVKALGAALLAALEKKDAEELSRLRASHETNMLELVTAVRERQVLATRANKENLLKARETAGFRLQHYIALLGNDSVTVPAAPTIAATLTAGSQLPPDTSIPTIETDVDDSLVDSDESGVKLIAREASDIRLSQQASDDLFANLAAEVFAGFMGLIPQFDGEGTPLGVGAGVGFGGRELGWFAGSAAKMFAISSQMNSLAAAKSAKMASYVRREQDWTLQANLSAREIIQLDKQITSADIQIQVAEKELENHHQQIEDTKEVELFLKDKFTNQELYQWMKEQLFAIYKQSYNLAFDMAKKAEKAYRYEMGTDTASFIQYGYWDNSRQGLVAGEKLQLALRQLEKSYLEENRRELELTKHVSLAMLNPLALIELRETGKCYLSLSEALFDLDFQGHYFRRIKSVSLSIPCIAGPFTTVNCSLRLLSSTIRANTSMNSEGDYEHEHDEGVWIDDSRFRTSYVPVTSIATSSGQNDRGLFEFNFRDERYLPFEGAGAISDWQLELTTEKELRQFDYSTISDVILHVNYTARENGGLFKESAIAYIQAFISNAAELADQPLMRLFSMRHEFPTEWHRFFYPAAAGGEQRLSFTIGAERLPFFAQDRNITVMKMELFARCAQAGDYHLIISNTDLDGDTVTSSQITMPQNASYGGLNKATINVNDAGLNLEELDVAGPMSLKVKHNTAADYTSLVADPPEVEEIYLVLLYKLG